MSAYTEMSQSIHNQENEYAHDNAHDNAHDDNAYDNVHDDNDYDDNANHHNTIKNKFGKNLYFPSNSSSRNIVHAETNSVYDFTPGSFESLRLYNVILSTNTDKNDSLYYNSPEEYAQHRGVQVNKQDVDSWHSQKERLFPGGDFNKESYETVRKEKLEKRINDQEIRRVKANKLAEQQHKLIQRIKNEEAETKKPRKYRLNRSKVMNRSPMNHPLHNSWIIARQANKVV